MQEVLTRLLRKNFEEGRTGSYYHPRGAPLVSHLLYADDLLIFANGEKRSIKMLLRALDTYALWSGQLINKDKSALFLSKKINYSRKCGLLRMTGFVEGSFLLLIWGCL